MTSETSLTPPTGQITGTKWNDLNGNGTREPNEPGLLGWRIGLFQAGQELSVEFTGSDGTYTFSNLADGTYDVCETLISGWNQTVPSSGFSCQALTGSGFGHTVTITAGQVVSGIDFGNRLPDPCPAARRARSGTI